MKQLKNGTRAHQESFSAAQTQDSLAGLTGGVYAREEKRGIRFLVIKGEGSPGELDGVSPTLVSDDYAPQNFQNNICSSIL